VNRLWIWRSIDAPAEALWELLVDPARWPEWGPSVRSAAVDGQALRRGARGTVSTVLGVDLPFEVTSYVEGSEWSWNVIGVPATDHRVVPISGGRCRVGFAVPWPEAPYLVVCRAALRRLDAIASQQKLAA
jgi:hypothetical protein